MSDLPPILVFNEQLDPEKLENLRIWARRVEQAAAVRERDRIISLAYMLEEQNLAVSAGRIAAAAHMVVKTGPLHVDQDGETMTVTRDVQIADDRAADGPLWHQDEPWTACSVHTGTGAGFQRECVQCWYYAGRAHGERDERARAVAWLRKRLDYDLDSAVADALEMGVHERGEHA